MNNKTETIEILVPTWEIASNPTVRLSDIKARRFQIFDKVDEMSRLRLIMRLLGVKKNAKS